MAKDSSSTPYAPGQTEEAKEANRAYQEALAKLTQSLDQRKNRFFDPVWLAAAQGFMKPGTSNFFESLGNVAGNISQAQEALVKEDQGIAQQRLDLAGRGVELQRQRGKEARWRSAYDEGSAPQGGLAAAAQPSAAQSQGAGSGALPSGGQGSSLAQADTGSAPSGLPFMPGRKGPTRQQFFAAAEMDGKSLSDTMKEWEALQKGQYEIKDKFGVHTPTGQIFMVPTGNMVPTQIFREDGTVGTYNLPESVAAQLSFYAGKGDADSYFKLANQYIKGPQRPTAAPQATAPSNAAPGAPASQGASAARPATPAAPGAAGRTGLPTVDESELAKARAKTLQEAETQIEVENRKDFFQKSRDADDSITTANMLRRFSEDPNVSQMVGILNNDKISSGIAKLVEQGVGTRDYRIGIPAIQDVMRNAGLSPADQAKYRVFLMNTALMRLQMSKYMKGSVSNYEQELMGEAAVSAQDTKETIRMKADLLTRRAQFDRRVYRAFKASKMTAEEFLDSKDYQEMRDEYDKELTAISIGDLQYQSGAAKAAASPAGGAATPAAAPQAGGAARPATAGAGQPSPGFIRDPDTKKMRRKLPGE